MRERFGFGAPHRGCHGGREYQRRRVVGDGDLDHCADREDQREEAERRAFGRARGVTGGPIENPFAPREFGQYHHARQEEIDVEPASDRRFGDREWNEARKREYERAGRRPDPLRDAPRARNDARDAEGADRPDRDFADRSFSTIKQRFPGEWTAETRRSRLRPAHQCPTTMRYNV